MVVKHGGQTWHQIDASATKSINKENLVPECLKNNVQIDFLSRSHRKGHPKTELQKTIIKYEFCLPVTFWADNITSASAIAKVITLV